MNGLGLMFRGECVGGFEFVDHLFYDQVEAVGFGETTMGEKNRDLGVDIGESGVSELVGEVVFVDPFITESAECVLTGIGILHHDCVDLIESLFGNWFDGDGAVDWHEDRIVVHELASTELG